MASSDLETLETEEGGNTNNPSSSPKKQPLQHIHHTFTWNNYPIEAIETIQSFFNHFAYDYVFQEEIGDSGTPHLQGVVSLKRKMRWTEFGLPRCIHWEKVEHVPACYEYCSRASKRCGNCWSLKYTVPKKLKILDESKLFEWQKEVITHIKSEPDDRSILWLWSEVGGIGKSTFVKYLVYTYNAILCGKGVYSDIINIMYKANMDKSNLVVFDLPRNNGNKISYSALEAIKNGCIVNTKYETGSKIFNPPHIIVFSNASPEDGAMSADKLVVRCLD